jgi:hypothetical protein
MEQKHHFMGQEVVVSKDGQSFRGKCGRYDLTISRASIGEPPGTIVALAATSNANGRATYRSTGKTIALALDNLGELIKSLSKKS